MTKQIDLEDTIRIQEQDRRMKVLLWAYAYEFVNIPMASDAEFDALCQEVDVSIDTLRPDLDEWFRENFQPHTGMWVRSLPDRDLTALAKIYKAWVEEQPPQT